MLSSHVRLNLHPWLLCSGEKSKSRALFTGGKGTKKIKGKTQWNKDGILYFNRAGLAYQALYKNEKMMDMIYRGWNEWLVQQKKTGIVGDSSNKTYHSIMGTWTRSEGDTHLEDRGEKGGMNNNSDSDDFGEDDGGYNSDLGATKRRVWGKGDLKNEESEMGVEKNADENNSSAAGSSDGKGEGTTSIESPARNTRASKKGKKSQRLF